MAKLRLLAISLGATVAFSGGAAAATQVGSQVTIHLPPGGSAAYLYGLVHSGKGACESHRTLKILQDPTGTSGYALYAKGIRSNSDGTWTYEPPSVVVNGYYKAVALKKSVPGAVCTKSHSKPFLVD